MKSRRTRGAMHMTNMGRGEMYSGYRWRNLNEREHLDDPDAGDRMILN